MENNTQIDASVVIRKLQDRLAEAITTIAVLEAQIESLTSTADVAPTPSKQGALFE